MIMDTLLAGFVAVSLWRWSRAAAFAVFGLLVAVDLAFLGANVLKIPQGGWFPLLIAAGIFILTSTWVQGRTLLFDRIHRDSPPLAEFVERTGPSLDRFLGPAGTSDERRVGTACSETCRSRRAQC